MSTPTNSATNPATPTPRGLTRRKLLACVGAGLAAGVGGRKVWEHVEGFHHAETFVASARSYEIDLARVVREGLAELGIGRATVRGKSVLLKPNLVEPHDDGQHVTTHPALVRAVAEVFRGWDAREVFVAEGPGHCRDTDLLLERTGLGTLLAEEDLEFVDLNLDEVEKARNRLGYTELAELWLPRSLRRADLIVSMPKLKTHHWAGVTLSMKNFFGVMPGACYGWPKNVLHHAGIPQSILDITATVRPHLAIVDGIVGMEGDGPIHGTPRHAGVLVLGTNLPAVDATAARLMGIDPHRVPYLALASGHLGPIAEAHIRQRGEPIAALRQDFQLLDHPAQSWAHLRSAAVEG